jgi:hypothetical protein
VRQHQPPDDDAGDDAQQQEGLTKPARSVGATAPPASPSGALACGSDAEQERERRHDSRISSR